MVPMVRQLNIVYHFNHTPFLQPIHGFLDIKAPVQQLPVQCSCSVVSCSPDGQLALYSRNIRVQEKKIHYT